MTDDTIHTTDTTTEDDTIVPDKTETFPRALLADRPADRTRVQLDGPGLFDLDPPTAVTPAPARRTPPVVSPPGAHTRGAAALTPPAGVPVVPVPAPVAARLVDRLADEARQPTGRKAPKMRKTRKAPLTLRQEAERRQRARLRHERHLDVLETVRAYLAVACMLGLFVIVVTAGVICYGLIVGWFGWGPTVAE